MKTIWKIIKWGMLILTILIAVLVVSVLVFMNTAPQFGAEPEGERLRQIEESSNYREGKFRNPVKTEMNMDLSKMPRLLYSFLLKNREREPSEPLPVKFSNLNTTTSDSVVHVTWYGHSAIFLEMEGINIFLDPMLGPASSPVSFMTKRFPYQEPINLDEIPDIEIVILSHDHYDHLDYKSIKALKDRVKHFFVPLGVGSHLRKWGVEGDKITEMDWWESIRYKHINLVTTPARHFSGRKRAESNKTLWASWVIEGKSNKLFFSGDGGYFPGFKEIGDKFGPFDFTMMECGQYNEQWEAIHMMPEQTLQANLDLKGKIIMPIHWGAFNLSLHTWTDPAERLLLAAQKYNVPMASPFIGQRFSINGDIPVERWWQALDN